MARPSLSTAYALIDRAGEHLYELERIQYEIVAAEAESFVANPVEASPISLPDGRQMFAAGRFTNIVVPDKARVLLGEICTNLRSALDYLVVRLSELDSGVKHRRTQFPIEPDKKGFKGQRKTYLAGVSDTHVAAIERLQPYNGCEWTKLLAGLSNFHKHDDLVFIGQKVKFTASVAPTEGNPGEGAVSVKFEISHYIAFDKEGPVIETLGILQSQVAQTLDAFKPEF
jgi:hypothetical protein